MQLAILSIFVMLK